MPFLIIYKAKTGMVSTTRYFTADLAGIRADTSKERARRFDTVDHAEDIARLYPTLGTGLCHNAEVIEDNQLPT